MNNIFSKEAFVNIGEFFLFHIVNSYVYVKYIKLNILFNMELMIFKIKKHTLTINGTTISNCIKSVF